MSVKKQQLSESSRNQDPSPAGYPLGLIVPAAVGTILRLINLEPQVMGGDELHAVAAAAQHDLGWILTHHGVVNHGIPLTAMYRLLIDFGVELDELWLRFPPLLAGVALLWIAPRWVSCHINARTAHIFAWLLAISPLHVLYSRNVRSYSLIVLLSFLALAAFWRWWQHGGRRFAFAYALTAAAAIWFFLIAAPLVLAPLAYAIIKRCYPKAQAQAQRTLPEILGVALTTATIGAILLGPSMASLGEDMENRFRDGAFDLSGIGEALGILAGTPSGAIAGLFWAAGLIGCWRLARTGNPFAWFSAFVVGCHFVFVFVSTATAFSTPQMISRYCLVALPLVLIWVATSFVRKNDRLRWGTTFVFVVTLAFAGPLLKPGYYKSVLAHHGDRLGLGSPPEVEANRVPEFYSSIRSEEGVILLEGPWNPLWRCSRAFLAYEAKHGKAMQFLARKPYLDAPGIALHHLRSEDPESILLSNAKYLVVHHDLVAEEAAFTGRKVERMQAGCAGHKKSLQNRALRLIKMAHRWDPPIYADELISVWDLDAARQ